MGNSSSLKNTLKILDFGFSTLVRKGPVVEGLKCTEHVLTIPASASDHHHHNN
jgi:hypothetical protein